MNTKTHGRTIRLGAMSFLLGMAVAVNAQTTSLTPVAIFQTGGGAAFLSSTQSVHFSANGPRIFEFGFGFETDEAITPSTFFDSFTFNIAHPTESLVAVLATADTSGAQFRPVTPGAVALQAQHVLSSSIEYSLGASPTLSKQVAFWLRVTIPDEMPGDDFVFYSDFFDNGNGVPSIAWVGPVTIVPEPSTWALLSVGVIFLFAFKWRTE